MPIFPEPPSATRESSSATVRRLQIFVLFNGPEATTVALRTANSFASGLGGDILIAAPQLVPYPLPLNSPDIDREALLRQINQSVQESHIACPIRKVLISYARDCRDAWRELLPSHCIVVVGKPAWRFPILRLHAWLSVKSLSRLGHEVVEA